MSHTFYLENPIALPFWVRAGFWTVCACVCVCAVRVSVCECPIPPPVIHFVAVLAQVLEDVL